MGSCSRADPPSQQLAPLLTRSAAAAYFSLTTSLIALVFVASFCMVSVLIVSGPVMFGRGRVSVVTIDGADAQHASCVSVGAGPQQAVPAGTASESCPQDHSS